MDCRVLLLTLEYLSPFSGNGQYSRCIVRGLRRAGASVLVVSGRPAEQPLSSQDAECQSQAAAGGLIDLPLPTWGRLDRQCAYAAFGSGCCSAACAAACSAFCPTVVVCVDYHAGLAWAPLRAALTCPVPPMVYLNFRLFCTSAALHAPPGPQDAEGVSDAQFYRSAERASMAGAALTVALCRQDALQLLALAAGLDPLSGEQLHSPLPAAPAMATLLPPLRSDMASPPPPPSQADAAAGLLLTSLVRLSPEKNASAVPLLLAALGEAGGAAAAAASPLPALGLAPFFAGCSEATPYAEQVKAAAAALPAAVLCRDFMGPKELGLVLQRAALNVHPCLADAYGMTIVEAAAWGVPSLVHIPAPPVTQASAAAAPLPCTPGSLFEHAWSPPATASATATATATASDSCCCTRLTLQPLAGAAGPSGAPAFTSALGATLLALSRTLPSVGACDLLAPHPTTTPPRSNGVLCFDFTASPQQQAQQLAPLLQEAVAVHWGQGEGTVVGDVRALARQRALAWTEEAHGQALKCLLLGAGKA